MTFASSIEAAFKKKKREDGEPYFNHLVRVHDDSINYVTSISTLEDQGRFETLTSRIKTRDKTQILQIVGAIAIAHDYLEDIGDTKDLFHLITDSELSVLDPKDVAFIMESVLALSRKKDESYFSFIARVVESNHVVKMIKLSDLRDNLKTGEEGSRKDKYRFAKEKITLSFW